MFYGGLTPTGPAIDLAAGVLSGGKGFKGDNLVVSVK
jgi:hypothetical protein